MSEASLRSWTVLLLYPDYIADNYGQETYLTWVNAHDAGEAERLAQQEAVQTGGHDASDAENFAPLFVTLGMHPNLMEVC